MLWISATHDLVCASNSMCLYCLLWEYCDTKYHSHRVMQMLGTDINYNVTLGVNLWKTIWRGLSVLVVVCLCIYLCVSVCLSVCLAVCLCLSVYLHMCRFVCVHTHTCPECQIHIVWTVTTLWAITLVHHHPLTSSLDSLTCWHSVKLTGGHDLYHSLN